MGGVAERRGAGMDGGMFKGRRKRVWVFVALLAGAQLPALLTGARTVSVCGVGACLTTAQGVAGAE